MNLLPNFERAVIEDSKLKLYALDPENERGRHKAKVFKSALGFTKENWKQLKQVIIEALAESEATFINETSFGRKYRVISVITGPNTNQANLLTIWQYDRQPDGSTNNWPRLITLYII